jgi:hypothetical protein
MTRLLFRRRTLPHFGGVFGGQATGYALKTLAENEQKAYQSNKGPCAEFAMEYCPCCFDGFIHMKAMKKTRDGYEEVTSARKSVRLDRAVAHDFLVKVVSPTN